ncbi:MAG TPA: hypothetical protein VNZ54_02230 [bacterium]|nr:hypothetical protein [bacterium]
MKKIQGALQAALRVLRGQAGSTPTGQRGQTPRKIVPSGRVQAPRHDSPRGPRAKAR